MAYSIVLHSLESTGCISYPGFNFSSSSTNYIKHCMLGYFMEKFTCEFHLPSEEFCSFFLVGKVDRFVSCHSLPSAMYPIFLLPPFARQNFVVLVVSSVGQTLICLPSFLTVETVRSALATLLLGCTPAPPNPAICERIASQITGLSSVLFIPSDLSW